MTTNVLRIKKTYGIKSQAKTYFMQFANLRAENKFLPRFEDGFLVQLYFNVSIMSGLLILV